MTPPSEQQQPTWPELCPHCGAIGNVIERCQSCQQPRVDLSWHAEHARSAGASVGLLLFPALLLGAVGLSVIWAGFAAGSKAMSVIGLIAASAGATLSYSMVRARRFRNVRFSSAEPSTNDRARPASISTDSRALPTSISTDSRALPTSISTDSRARLASIWIDGTATLFDEKIERACWTVREHKDFRLPSVFEPFDCPTGCRDPEAAAPTRQALPAPLARLTADTPWNRADVSVASALTVTLVKAAVAGHLRLRLIYRAEHRIPSLGKPKPAIDAIDIESSGERLDGPHDRIDKGQHIPAFDALILQLLAERQALEVHALANHLRDELENPQSELAKALRETPWPTADCLARLEADCADLQALYAHIVGGLIAG
jgi:hypothetical protein